MQHLPPIPRFEKEMQISQRIEFEIDSEGLTFNIAFEFKISVNFETEKKEISIECIEEHNIPEAWE